jgi:riboflavin synthase
MFSGIVQAVAPIKALEKVGSLLRYAVAFPFDYLTGLTRGASVSIDGVCQTVVGIEGNSVWFEAIGETLARTTFNQMRIGSQVNLERSVKFGDEIGGHLLSGHIYGAIPISDIKENVYTFACPPNGMKYLFSKGYIAIDGISLTIVDADRQRGHFTVHLIPETLQRTTLGQKKAGSLVNLELDALTQAAVETIEHHLEAQAKSISLISEI